MMMNLIDQIFNEDCLDGMKRLPDKSVDLICTDPPYNITDCSWERKIDWAAFWIEANRILKPQSSAVMFASGKFTFELVNSNFKQFKYKWVWLKNKVTCFVHAKNCPMRKHEDVLVFSNGSINHVTCTNNRMRYFPQGVRSTPPRLRQWQEDCGVQLRGHKFNSTKMWGHGKIEVGGVKCRGLTRFNAKDKFGGTYGERPSHVDIYTSTKTGYPADILEFDVVHNVGRLNATQKPVELVEYLIKTYTDENNVVLDCFLGSGTTAIAAMNTNRHFIGFEIDTGNYEAALNRITKAQAERQSALL